MGVFGDFSVLKLDFLTSQSIDGQGVLGGECSIKFDYFYLLSPGVHAFPPRSPLSQNSGFFGILQAGGPNNWNMWTATGKIISFSDAFWSTYFSSRRVCG